MRRHRTDILLLWAALAICGPAAAGAASDDPAYAAYRKAYEFILREEWKEARDAFRELTRKYPTSEYADDAAYWIAYSWRDSDRRRAMEAYNDFIREHRESSYFDDAVADIGQLMARSLPNVSNVPPLTGVPAVPGDPVVLATPGHPPVAVLPGELPAPAIAPVVKFSRLEGMLRGRLAGPWGGRFQHDTPLDERTRLRLEALYAVGRAGEDAKGFEALRGVAVDPREDQMVRVAAIEALAGFRRHNVLPVFLEIARNDTSEEMQLFAIDYIGHAARDKDRALDALLELYRGVRPADDGKRSMIFYSIAGIGNDRAVEFLGGVAKSGADYPLRREAVHYLGTIGGEKARAVLLDILEGGAGR